MFLGGVCLALLVLAGLDRLCGFALWIARKVEEE